MKWHTRNILILAIAATLCLSTMCSAASLEHLGQPCRSRGPAATCLVTDRSDGRERLAIVDSNESGFELLFLDFERDTVRSFKSGDPQMTTAWGMIEVPKDRLVIGTAGPSAGSGRLVIFDLKKMEFAKVIPCGSERFVWNLAIGSDGRVYAGTGGGGKLYALDLDTYQVEDLGAHGLPNVYLRYVSALPDGRILCRFEFEEPISLIYDPSTHKFKPVPNHLKDIQEGISWRGYFLTLGSLVCDGKTLARVKPPFPVPQKDNWRFEPALTSDDAVFFRSGSALYLWSPGDKDITRFADADLRGGKIVARAKGGSVIGIRGQDYFVLEQGDKTLNLKAIPGQSTPRPTSFLRVDGLGRVWGGAPLGQTVFWLDPKTREAHNTRSVNSQGGQVYDAAFYAGKVYFAAYTLGGIIEYDPNQPWDEYNNKNPKVLATAKGYVRPEAGITLGPDGKLYVGLMAKYGTYGGAVLITDPNTGASELIENPLGEQAVASVVPGDGVLFVGTNCQGDGMPSRYEVSTRFGIIDLATKEADYIVEPGGSAAVRVLGYESRSQRVVLAVGKAIWLFDAAGLVFPREACKDAPELTCGSVGWAVGKLYYGSQNWVVALDVGTGTAERIVEAPQAVSHVALAPDGTIYIACGSDVYRLKQ